MKRQHIRILGVGYAILLVLSAFVSVQVGSVVPIAGFGIAAVASIAGIVHVNRNSGK